MEWHRLAQHNWQRHGLLFALARQGSNAAERSLARAPFCACQAKQQRSTQQRTNAVLHGLLVLLARQGSNAAERSLARAPCFACQAKQKRSKQQRSRTQSCTGSLFCLPGEAATQMASTTVIQHDGHPARRSSSTTARYGANPGRLGGTPCWGIVWGNMAVNVITACRLGGLQLCVSQAKQVCLSVFACQCDHSLPSTQAKQVRGNMAVDDTTTSSCVSHNRQCKAKQV